MSPVGALPPDIAYALQGRYTEDLHYCRYGGGGHVVFDVVSGAHLVDE